MAILRKSAQLVGAILLFAFGMSCQIERGKGLFADQVNGGGGAPGDGGRLLTGEPEGPLENVNGFWMLYVEDRVCIESDLVAEPTENIIWSRYLVQMTGSAGGAVVKHSIRLCDQELSPLPLDLRTVVPKALTDGLPIRDVAGFLVGGEPGSGYVTEIFFDLWGVETLMDGEALPTEVDDPRVRDQDGDEQPGVTLKLTNDVGDEVCEVYVVQKTQLQLEGSVISSRRIEGEVRSVPFKEVLDSSSALCSSGDLVKSRAQSVFYLVRVDGVSDSPDLDLDANGEVDCVELRGKGPSVLSAYGISQNEPDGQYCGMGME